ncbi:MAG TPA: hypothetical protein VJ805_07245 [Nitrospiraceae bacterium]|nr:hypothetical protein [Nitrospiraceae bacterium]
MTEQELNRAIQYVTASTSYSKDLVGSVLRAGFDEMTQLAVHATSQFSREDLMGYICQWSMKQTGQPEPLVREILDCAGRWLDDMSNAVPTEDAPQKSISGGDEPETGAVS